MWQVRQPEKRALSLSSTCPQHWQDAGSSGSAAAGVWIHFIAVPQQQREATALEACTPSTGMLGCCSAGSVWV